jgi:hypothetical protein
MTLRSLTGSGVEQMLHPRISLRLIAVFAVILSTCHKSTEPGSPGVVAYQVPGCASQLGKRVLSDSCFSYQFRDALLVDFCASANCCPDSNRFSITHRVSTDSIIVTIADTAAQLCRCNCPYVLHVEFHDLPKDSYLLVCERRDYSSHILLYAQPVHRQ